MKVLLAVFIAALVFVSGASSAPEFTLRPVSQTAKTVTFTWPRQSKADGYLFLRNGVPVARTMNGVVTSATFWKGSRYMVAVLHRAPGGRVTTTARAVFVPGRAAHSPRPHVRKARLVFVPAPSPKFSLRVVDRTPKTVTFAWRSQPGADGYQFVRDGAVVARTLNRSTTTATFWKGSRYAVDVLRLASGNDKVVIPIRRALAVRPAATRKPRAARSGLVFHPAPKIDFRLRLVRQTKRTVTFSWKRQPKADGYRFLRNNVPVAQTFNRSTTTATFWKGSRYAVEVLRVAPGKRITSVMRALAFTASARASDDGSGTTSGASAATSPASPGSTSPPARESGTNDSPSPAPKPAPPATKPPAPQPAPPPAPAPAPAPAPTPSPSAFGPGGFLSLSGTYSPNAFFQAVAVAPPGPLTVRGPFTITGDVTITRPDLRIEGATVDGTVGFHAGASGSSLLNSHAMGFDIFGADNVVIEGNDLDGRGTVFQNHIWDAGGDTPDGWAIRGNSLSNYYHGDDHSEALFIGYSRNGVVEGNTFTNNGTTAHIFFSWYGGIADPNVSWPRNICVRGNTFNATAGAYFDVNFREEIPTSANIKIQRDASASTVDYRFYGDC
jgi:hypothetical protein